MAARSFSATLESLEIINRAMAAKQWSREDLAKVCDCSRQPAVKFCSGKSVSKKLFVSFCNELGLNWEEIAGLKAPQVNEAKAAESTKNIDSLVQEVRRKVKKDIEYRCGTMRVLDMEQKIGLDDIYTSVNILEKLSGRQRLGIDELLANCQQEDFERFALAVVRQERVPGLAAVERNPDGLMILGKPGAGKTTFMKRMATLCNLGKFQPERVPVFVTLKEFAEAKGQLSFEEYIAWQWKNNCDMRDVSVKALANTGRLLILLDGLDEVQEAEHDRVIQEIRNVTRQYRDCQFVVTCRIASREYTFEQF